MFSTPPRKLTLALGVAAVLATAPALAADWAHNDPDKASTGQVQIWDGSKTVTVNSAPATAVATMGGSAALGQVVTSKLTLAEFIAVNDLEAANWKDITWRSGADTVSIADTNLAEKSGKASYQKVKADGAPVVNKYYSGNMFYTPPGSNVTFTQNSAYTQSTSTRTSSRRNGDVTSTRYHCYRVDYYTSKSGETTLINSRTTRLSSSLGSRSPCSTVRTGSFTLTVSLPPAPATPNLNYFLKVNE